MKHIFISYSRKNSEYTHRLRDALTSRNLPVWIDEHIPVGAVWPQEIHKAIGDSFAVIVLMTPDSMQSRWVQKEVLWAGQKEILTMPLLVEDCDFFGLHDIQYVDVRHGGLPPE